MITIIDYGIGNLGSVLNMFKKINVPAKISNNPEEILFAQKILLPGVGSFDAAMNIIHETGLFDVLNYVTVKRGIPILGICLGMQLLMESSEEGDQPGFGWIKGTVNNFRGRISKHIKVPHMGWNDVTISGESQLTKGFGNEIRFYFVHSYYVQVKDSAHSMMKCHYGLDFDAAVHNNNIFGVQFHPEKSHRFGLQVLKNFAAL